MKNSNNLHSFYNGQFFHRSLETGPGMNYHCDHTHRFAMLLSHVSVAINNIRTLYEDQLPLDSIKSNERKNAVTQLLMLARL